MSKKIITEKYNVNRSKIQNGDIILFRSNGFMGRLISFFDNAEFTHIGVCFECNKRLMIIDSMGNGVHPDFLSIRIKTYDDFLVLRSRNSRAGINLGVEKAFVKAEEGIKYDFALLLKVAFKRKFGINTKRLGSSKRDICSEWVRRYTNMLNISCYNTDNIITPQDFMRLLSNVEIQRII